MRRRLLALSSLLLLAPLLVLAQPAAAATSASASCTDGSHHRWKLKASWGGIYTDRGTARVSAQSVSFTTTSSKVSSVDYTVTVVDGTGTTVQSLVKNNKKHAFKKGKSYLKVNPKNPASAPGVTRVVVAVRGGKDTTSRCTVTFRQPGTASTTPTAPAAPPVSAPTAPAGSWPSAPPAQVCGNAALLAGPITPPTGATTVPAGDNSRVDFGVRGRTYWFAPGVHTLGRGTYDQIQPGDSSSFVGAPGAVLDGQGTNAYAFTAHATDVRIAYLTITNFVAPMNEGTVNHDSGERWTVEHSTITRNGGAGLFLGSGSRASYNCLSANSQYGFQAYSSAGPRDIVLDHNEITGNNTGDWESKVSGCGCTGGGKFWDARDVSVTDNYVHHNASVGLWADTNDNNFLIEGNWISDNAGQAIFWEISYNVAIRNNVIRHNLTVGGPERMRSGDNFPDAAIYISESGGDARLPYDRVGTPTIDIAGNLVDDNYNGVTLWENADRFCGSPANTSSGYCTQVDPVATLASCTSKNIAREPYFSACRWKTQNVKVHHNTFTLDRAHLGGCGAGMCGRNAVISNWGTYPSWSPYQGDGVGRRMAFSQGNTFSDNVYSGSWHVTAQDTGTLLSPAAWQAAPYGQDRGSTFG